MGWGGVGEEEGFAAVDGVGCGGAGEGVEGFGDGGGHGGLMFEDEVGAGVCDLRVDDG